MRCAVAIIRRCRGRTQRIRVDATDNAEDTSDESFTQMLRRVSQWAIPALILLIIVSAAYKRVPMYESFVTGAKEGFNVAVMIIPYLVAILFVIKVFVASGIFDDIKYGLAAAMNVVGLAAYTESLDLLPLGADQAAHRRRSAGCDAGNLRHCTGPTAFSARPPRS